jgi:hypothetical protein
VPGADGSRLNGSLQAVNRFTLVEQVENAVAEFPVAKIIAQVDGP